MKRDYQTLSLTQASAMYTGKLINDFSMLRVGDGWSIMLYLVGNEEIAVLREEAVDAEEPGKIFATADEALFAAYKIGFDVSRMGQFRLGAGSNQRLLGETINLLGRVVRRSQ